MPGKLNLTVSADASKAIAELQKVVAKLEENAQKARKLGQAGKKTTDDMSRGFSGLASSLAGPLIGMLSIGTALATINRSTRTWITNTQEAAKAASTAANEYIALAALQEGGTKAENVRRAQALGVRFGITDTGTAFNAVQALQSAPGGTFEKGLLAAETVFQASKIGVPLEDALEAEIQGLAQGAAPGQFIRQAFVAGQASSRSPAELVKGAKSLAFFDDKEFGFAAAGVLAAQFRDDLPTFVKAAGVGLSGVSTLRPKFDELGVGEGASRKERLKALREAGIDTPEELKTAGLGEIRQQQAISLLIKQSEQLGVIQGKIARDAVPGLLAGQRLGIEREIPEARLERENRILEARARAAQALGPKAIAGLEEEKSARLLGAALRDTGQESFLGFDAIDQAGRATTFARVVVAIDDVVGSLLDKVLDIGPGKKLETQKAARNAALDDIDAVLRGAAEQMSDAAGKLSDVASKLGGGTLAAEVAEAPDVVLEE